LREIHDRRRGAGLTGPGLLWVYFHAAARACRTPPPKVGNAGPESKRVQLELRGVVAALNIAPLRGRVLRRNRRSLALSFQRHSVMRGRGTLGAELADNPANTRSA